MSTTKATVGQNRICIVGINLDFRISSSSYCAQSHDDIKPSKEFVLGISVMGINIKQKQKDRVHTYTVLHKGFILVVKKTEKIANYLCK